MGTIIHLLPTLPETNVAPENQWLEDDFPFGTADSQRRTVSFRECIYVYAYNYMCKYIATYALQFHISISLHNILICAQELQNGPLNISNHHQAPTTRDFHEVGFGAPLVSIMARHGHRCIQYMGVEPKIWENPQIIHVYRVFPL